jgi:predicted permease
MYHEFFSKSPLLALPLLSLVIFIAVFAGAIVRVMGERGRRLERFAARIPLDDEEDVQTPKEQS